MKRIATRGDCLAKIRSAAQDLVRSRYALEASVPKLLDRASRQWQHSAANGE